MAWLKVDDRVRTHPKIVKAGPSAAWFWFCGICYCREHLTDGFIQLEMLPTLVPGETRWKKLAVTLVTSGLWHQADGGYQVHDFLDWNPTRASVLEQRRKDLERKKGKGKSDVKSNTESALESVGTPQGILTTPSRDHARVAGLGYGSSLGSSVLERSPGENQPLPKGTLTLSPLQLERQREKFWFYGERLKVPHVLHREFADKLGRHAPQLQGWYQAVNDDLARTGDGFDDIFKFLRPKFAEWARELIEGDEIAKWRPRGA